MDGNNSFWRGGLPLMVRARFVARAAMIAAPAIMAMLWLLTGREMLTGYGRPVEVLVIDVFGDSIAEMQLKPGPIFGYYVGLDGVGITAGASLFLGLVGWLIGRRRRRAAQETFGNANAALD